MSDHARRASRAMSASETSERPEDFSPFLGGPLYQLLLRIGLIKPPLDRVKWRAFVVVMIVWAPLVVLTLLDGRFVAGVKIPFLHDFEVQVRLLASIPLLILAEVTIHERVKAMILQFRERQIVTEPLGARFEEIKGSATRLRNSMAIEVGLAVAVLVIGRLSWQQLAQLQSDTWYATIAEGVRTNTLAGVWYQYVSIPISQFILLRWFFRLIIWWRVLWQISRLDLNLVPTHPDRTCGLGFLDGVVFAMGPFLLALSCLLSGSIANRLLWEGSKLPEHYVEIGVMAGFLAAIALGPLCVFTPALARAKRDGLFRYGKLASEYVNAFDRKWIGGERPPEEPLVGTADIQSLADLGNSFEIVQGVVPFPFGRSALIGLVVVVALPLLPLLLTMFSLEEMVLRLVKIVL
jgi:hypothetical protein